MKSKMAVKFAGYFFAIGCLIFFQSHISRAQNSSPNVKGKWKAYTETFEEERGMIPTNFTYSFEGMGKVSSDSDFSAYKSGTYKVSSNSIRIDFPDYFVNATIKGNKMIGTFTIRGKSGKSIWEAENVSSKDNNSSNRVTGNRSTTAGAINPDALKVLSVGKSSEGLVQCTPSLLCPAKGYRWVNPDDWKDFRVEKIP